MILHGDTIDNLGSLGDFYGGLLNPAIGILSVYLLIKNLKQNSELIKLTQDELRESTSQSSLARAALESQQLLMEQERFDVMLYKNIDAIEISLIMDKTELDTDNSSVTTINLEAHIKYLFDFKIGKTNLPLLLVPPKHELIEGDERAKKAVEQFIKHVDASKSKRLMQSIHSLFCRYPVEYENRVSLLAEYLGFNVIYAFKFYYKNMIHQSHKLIESALEKDGTGVSNQYVSLLKHYESILEFIENLSSQGLITRTSLSKSALRTSK